LIKPIHTRQALLDSIRDRCILIYGAGPVGRQLLFRCKSEGLEIRGFCDDSPALCGTFLEGIPVWRTEDAVRDFPDGHFLISMRWYTVFADQLRDAGAQNIYGGAVLFEDANLEEFPEDAGRILLARSSHQYVPRKNRFIIEDLLLIITERCTLVCEDCCNYMPLIKKPIDFSADKILYSLDVLLQYLDYLPIVDVLGGEPFVHKEWDRIIKALVDSPKVGSILIETNGTIVPSEDELSLLANDKVAIIFSDYGSTSTKGKRLVEAFDRHQVHYTVFASQNWNKIDLPRKHNRSHQANQEIFQRCPIRLHTNLIHGRLYRCTTAAAACELLSEIPEEEKNFFPLLKLHKQGFSHQEMQERLMAFIDTNEPPNFCDYCNRYINSYRAVAVQTKRL